MKTVIIGAGFSGLSAACYMARAGHEVVLLEKNAAPGGRARQLVRDGFRFDMGPTFYWMPDLIEAFFADFGKTPKDYYELLRLDPSYEIVFGPDDRLALPAGPRAVGELFERIEPGSGRFLSDFLRSARYNYRVAVDKVIHKPGDSALELLMPETLARVPQFLLSLRHTVRRGVKDERLRRILEFPALFLGARPDNTPSFYRFMNHADMGLGTWHIAGGMVRLVEALKQLAESLGARILTEQPAREIVVAADRAVGVRTPQAFFEADTVISSADYRHTERLLPSACRNYSEMYWQHRVFAPSALIYYIGFGRRLERVSHHTLFFDTSFEEHAAKIYDSPGWPDKPLFYASFPSQSDPTLCPAGCEMAIILIPTAAGLPDTPAVRERYYHQVMDRMEALTRQKLRGHVLFRESYAASDFVRDYHAAKGNAYGLANILTQTAFMRPKIRNRKLPNLFYTGQLTVPGAGVPTALVSGKLAAGCALSRIAIPCPHETYDYGSTLR
ncbi:phytoene desaturase family protein [Alistipes sp.]|uniref:phytoene desaturase family protein n=1 Tax=Alistipes sp. TaxID=1872444 RepID=UPI003AF1128C